jgi:hypothetical protein
VNSGSFILQSLLELFLLWLSDGHNINLAAYLRLILPAFQICWKNSFRIPASLPGITIGPKIPPVVQQTIWLEFTEFEKA